jgi:hypothetical protein
MWVTVLCHPIPIYRMVFWQIGGYWMVYLSIYNNMSTSPLFLPLYSKQQDDLIANTNNLNLAITHPYDS